MAGDWQTVKLGEHADLRGGFAFKSKDYADQGHFILRTVNIRDDGRITRDGAVFLPECLVPQYSRFALQDGDTLFVMVGATLGKIGFVKSNDLPALLNQNMWVIRSPDPTALDNRFLNYAFQYHAKRKLAWASGSARSFVRRDDFRDLEILLPPLEEQQAISCILGALDDKIELNRRMNRTLEEMARAIFKSWFVDFLPVRAKQRARTQTGDSVRAKAAGEQPPLSVPQSGAERQAGGLKPDLAALFPDAFEDSELGEIPRGWEASNLGQHFRLTMGQSPPGSTYNETGQGLPFYQGRRDFGFRFPSRRVFCSSPTRFAEPGDTLVSVRAPVGDVNMASERCAVGRGVAAIRHRSGGRSFTYYSMLHLGDRFGKFEAEGTVFGSINKADFERLPFVVPSPELLTAFDHVVSPLDDRIETCERQTSILADLRDTLLARLISGEVRVPDAERIVGRCV